MKQSKKPQRGRDPQRTPKTEASEVLYGLNPVMETLRAGRRRIFELFVPEDRLAERITHLVAEAENLGVTVTRTAPSHIGKLSGTEFHQNVAARVSPYPFVELADVLGRPNTDRAPFFLILDGVEDPMNLGALARTALGAGVDALFIPKDRAAMPTPTAVKASAGALEQLPVVLATNLNHLLQQKIAIVTPRPQTTRNRIMGIVTAPGHQMILLDTPGLHEPREEMNRQMVRVAMESLADADVALFLVDGNDRAPARLERRGEEYRGYLDGIRCPVVLALNKIDLLAPEQLLPVIDWYRRLHDFAAIVPVSALTGAGVEALTAELVARLPEGPQYYPDDLPTDATERFIAAEIIREKLMRRLVDESSRPSLYARQIVETSIAFKRAHDGGAAGRLHRDHLRAL